MEENKEFENNDFSLQSEDFKELIKDINSAKSDLLSGGFGHEKKKPDKSDLAIHEKVATQVFRRLLLRNAQLNFLTYLTKSQFSEFKIEKESISENIDEGEIKNSEPRNDIDFRAYQHAITDLFVEKAITYLDIQAKIYNRFGNTSYIIGIVVIITGITIAGAQYLNFDPEKVGVSWHQVMTRFILGFTFYGFVVLAAVGLWRLGRAMLDQAERLLERRHALRQGRLFVHLHDGNMSINDMEKAFNWNVSQPNAFSHMSTDAKAPWGAVLSELIKASAEIAKISKDLQAIGNKGS